MHGENHDLFRKRKFNNFPKNELLVTNDPKWFSWSVFWTKFSEALLHCFNKLLDFCIPIFFFLYVV